MYVFHGTGVGLGVGTGVAVGIAVGVGNGVGDGDGDGFGDGDPDGIALTLAVGAGSMSAADGLGDRVGEAQPATTMTTSIAMILWGRVPVGRFMPN